MQMQQFRLNDDYLETIKEPHLKTYLLDIKQCMNERSKFLNLKNVYYWFKGMMTYNNTNDSKLDETIKKIEYWMIFL